MPVKLIAPITARFTLDKTDANFGCEGEATYVEFRQARQREYQMRDQLMSAITREIKSGDCEDSIVLKQDWSMEQLYSREVYLTLSGCNLVNSSDEPIFKFKRTENGATMVDMSESEFLAAWGTLDTFITSEIIDKCHEANLWSNKGKKA
jgi:hypothetical protein